MSHSTSSVPLPADDHETSPAAQTNNNNASKLDDQTSNSATTSTNDAGNHDAVVPAAPQKKPNSPSYNSNSTSSSHHHAHSKTPNSSSKHHPSSAANTPSKYLTPLDKKERHPELNILPDHTIESFAKYIKEHDCKNIIVMSGAGISTSAGIPDFRTPGTGLYDNLAKYNLPFPEAVFDIRYFRRKPEPFFLLAKELFPGSFQPTLGHLFIKTLQEEGKLLRCYTQNIDTLERVAGIPEDYLVEAHGSFGSAKCIGSGYDHDMDMEDYYFGDISTPQEGPTQSQPHKPGCGHYHSLEFVRERVLKGEIPYCQKCNHGIVKPEITFFGESLPDRFHRLCPVDFGKADALIVIGTSLKVQPFAGLISFVDKKVPRLLINAEVVGTPNTSLIRNQPFDFTGNVNEYRRDALFLGTCDDGCKKLASLLGLSDKLEGVIKRAEEGSLFVSKDHDKPPVSPVGMSAIDHMLKDLHI